MEYLFPHLHIQFQVSKGKKGFEGLMEFPLGSSEAIDKEWDRVKAPTHILQPKADACGGWWISLDRGNIYFF